MGDSQYVNRKSAARSYRPSGYVRFAPLHGVLFIMDGPTDVPRAAAGT